MMIFLHCYNIAMLMILTIKTAAAMMNFLHWNKRAMMMMMMMLVCC